MFRNNSIVQQSNANGASVVFSSCFGDNNHVFPSGDNLTKCQCGSHILVNGRMQEATSVTVN